MATQSRKSKITFDEAINKYYKLKNEYDTSIEKSMAQLIKTSALTLTEKHDKFINLKKRCIACGKYGGTIFKQEGNILIAKCGNIDNPCRLDIQLQRAKYKNIFYEINNQHDLVNKKKIAVINTKLDFLFGFTNEQATISKFNTLKTDLIDTIKKYQELNEIYTNIVENLPNQPEIKQISNSLLLTIQNFKELIENFHETGTEQFLKEAINLYITQIVVTANQLQKLKYNTQYIYTNERDNTHHLIQTHYLPSQLQVIVPDTENKIIAFTI